MTEEEWRPVAGYEGLYEVSNMGRVRNRFKLMKQYINPGGYFFLKLSKNSEVKTGLIARLVAKSFIPNPAGKPEVNHKNGLKTDNNAVNLEWCTGEENRNHAKVNGLVKVLYGEDAAPSRLKLGEVMEIRSLYRAGVRSGRIAERFGIHPASAYQIAIGVRWGHVPGAAPKRAKAIRRDPSPEVERITSETKRALDKPAEVQP